MPAHLKLNAKRMNDFLEALETGAFVKDACRMIGMSEQGVYKAKRLDEIFAEKWDAAIDKGIVHRREMIEAEIKRRAVDGVEEPIFHKGMRIDTVKRFSDALLIFWAKAVDPDKYRENSQKLEHTGPGGQPLNMTVDVRVNWVKPKPEDGTEGGDA